MPDYQRLLEKQGFGNCIDVTARASVIDLFTENERCGIYILQFANGDLYVGQTVDMVRRFRDHKKTYDDIVYLRFKSIAEEELDAVEQGLIYLLQKRSIPLRNVVHASEFPSERPSRFDDIMPDDKQKCWLTDPAYIDAAGERLPNPDLRRKHAHKYQKLLGKPLSEDVIRGLREYVRWCIPAFVRSELLFWCCTCLPGNSGNLYARINIGAQEILRCIADDEFVGFAWTVTQSTLEEHVGQFLTGAKLFFKHNVYLANERYKPGGPDQKYLYFDGVVSDFITLIHQPGILLATRRFNLSLAKKGGNMNFKSHCYALADRFFEENG